MSSISGSRGVKLGLMREDAEFFKSAGKNRGTNDSANSRRELVLESLCNPPTEFLEDTYWCELRTKWNEFLAKLYTEPYDTIRVKRKGGRKFNYDMEIEYIHDNAVVHTIKAEFKHNSTKIDELPEYFSPAANKKYFSVTYGDYFYDCYVDQICALSEDIRAVKPTKAEYMKFLYQNEYKKHPFFMALYEKENVDPEFYKQKQAIVKESIRTYIETHLHSIDLKALTNDIRERQTDKVFILWDLENFRFDCIRNDEMEIVSATEVKNNNTIIALSQAGTKHEMLLRWKNHLGILYPAWQISLTR